MTSRILILLIFINLSANLFSQAGSILTNSINARSVALGNTYISQENNNAVFTNLAANSLSNKKFEIDGNYHSWMTDISDDYSLKGASSYLSINEKSSLALGVMNYSMPAYTLTDDNGNESGTFTPTEMNLALGYAYKFTDSTAISLTVQYLNSTLGNDYMASTVLFNLGFKSSYQNLDYGFMIRNLGPALKFQNQDVSLPLTIGGGLTYSNIIAQKHKLSASTDFSYISANTDNGLSLGVGCEYAYNQFLAVRTGYHHMSETIGLSAFSLGGGVLLKGVSIDFGWLLSDNILNNNFNISCSFQINKKPQELQEDL